MRIILSLCTKLEYSYSDKSSETEVRFAIIYIYRNIYEIFKGIRHKGYLGTNIEKYLVTNVHRGTFRDIHKGTFRDMHRGTFRDKHRGTFRDQNRGI